MGRPTYKYDMTKKNIVTSIPIVRQRQHIPARSNAGKNRASNTAPYQQGRSFLCGPFKMLKKKCSAVENRSREWRVEFRDASLQGYELGSRGIEMSRVFGIGSCIIMARMELDCEEQIPCVI
jgi:hypothetical protein